MERNAFEFDGGMVRLTLAGAVLAQIALFVFWMVMLGITVALLVVAGFEFAAYSVGFTPLWRL